MQCVMGGISNGIFLMFASTLLKFAHHLLDMHFPLPKSPVTSSPLPHPDWAQVDSLEALLLISELTLFVCSVALSPNEHLLLLRAVCVRLVVCGLGRWRLAWPGHPT